MAYLWVINMLLGSITTEPVASDLELSSSISEAQEAKNPEQYTDGLCGDHLDGSNLAPYISNYSVIAESRNRGSTRG